MNRKLTAKIQQIKPNLPLSAKTYADILVVEPENHDLLLRKGTIYSIFELTSSTEINTQVISKMIHDVLHDTYFQSDNISPIQSLEKSIAAVRDKVSKMSATELNIFAGVLWGNVMYLVKYGKAASFLIRDNEVKHVNVNAEGNFSATSGVIKDEDVLIFCTHEFENRFPPERLLSIAVPAEELPSTAVGLVLKFIVDTSFSETEQIDFGMPTPIKKKGVKIPNPISAVGAMLAKRKSKETPEQDRAVMPEKSFTEQSIAPSVVPSTPSMEFSADRTLQQNTPLDTSKETPQAPREALQSLVQNQTVKVKPVRKIKITPIAVIAVTGVLLVISILYTISKKEGATLTQNAETSELSEIQNSTLTMDNSQKTEIEEIQPSYDESTKTQTVKPEIFYDIKITDPQANPAIIAVNGNSIIAADTGLGKMFISDQSTPKFTAEETKFAQISNLQSIDGDISFTDSEGYKTYDVSTSKVVESYAQTGLGVTYPYLEFIYTISSDQIIKYTKEGTALSSSTWAQNTDFSGAKSMSIAVSIFVLKSDGTLVRYTRGEKDSFSVTGLSQPFSNPKQVITDLDWENLYIADTGNNRVVILTKDGTFERQIIPTDKNLWHDIKSIAVTTDEKTLYVLDGSKVYAVNLDFSL